MNREVWEPLAPDQSASGLPTEQDMENACANMEAEPAAGFAHTDAGEEHPSDPSSARFGREVYDNLRLGICRRYGQTGCIVFLALAIGLLIGSQLHVHLVPVSVRTLPLHRAAPKPAPEAFEDKVDGFSLPAAQAFAAMSKLASCGEAPGIHLSLQRSCGPLCHEAGFQIEPGSVHLISKEDPRPFHQGGMPGALSGYVAKLSAIESNPDQACVLVLRGAGEASVESQNFNISQDRRMVSVKNCDGCKIHAGYAAFWQMLAPEVERQMSQAGCHPPMKTFVTGYSLGGAVGILAMWHLEGLGYEVQPSYVFEAPPVGNMRFAEAFTNRLGWKVPLFRVTHGRSPLPVAEQLDSVLKHISREVYFPNLEDSIIYTACGGLEGAVTNCQSAYLLDKALGRIEHGSSIYLMNDMYGEYLGVCGDANGVCTDGSSGSFTFTYKSEHRTKWIVEIAGGRAGARLLPGIKFYLRQPSHQTFLGVCEGSQVGCADSSFGISSYASMEESAGFVVEISDGSIFLKNILHDAYIGVCGRDNSCGGSSHLVYGYFSKNDRSKWSFEVEVEEDSLAKSEPDRCPSPLAPEGSFCTFGEQNSRFMEVCILGRALDENIPN